MDNMIIHIANCIGFSVLFTSFLVFLIGFVSCATWGIVSIHNKIDELRNPYITDLDC